MRRPVSRGDAVRSQVIDVLLSYALSAQAQADLMMIRARAGLVRTRTALTNTARDLAKSYGERLRGCTVRNMNPEKAEGLSPEPQRARLAQPEHDAKDERHAFQLAVVKRIYGSSADFYQDFIALRNRLPDVFTLKNIEPKL